jgi:hypothetical protein
MTRLPSKVSSFVQKHTATSLFSFILVAGLIMIVVASLIPGRYHLLHEIVRDIGIAFLVASIVGGIYDLHARSRYDIETMSGVLAAILGDFVSGEVWAHIKEQILSKSWMRNPLALEFSLSAPAGPDLPHPGLTVLRLRMSYDIHNLKAVKQVVKVIHRLDFHRTYQHLPRFTAVHVAGRPLAMEVLREGQFDEAIMLNPRGGKGVHVRVDREEVIYVPGSYNLVMTGLAKGLKISLEDIPDNVLASVNIRPHIDKPISLQKFTELQDELEDVLLLPGQVVEIIFALRTSDPRAGVE